MGDPGDAGRAQEDAGACRHVRSRGPDLGPAGRFRTPRRCPARVQPTHPDLAVDTVLHLARTAISIHSASGHCHGRHGRGHDHQPGNQHGHAHRPFLCEIPVHIHTVAGLSRDVHLAEGESLLGFPPGKGKGSGPFRGEHVQFVLSRHQRSPLFARHKQTPRGHGQPARPGFDRGPFLSPPVRGHEPVFQRIRAALGAPDLFCAILYGDGHHRPVDDLGIHVPPSVVAQASTRGTSFLAWSMDFVGRVGRV
eukprot:scaffold1554_cov332-Pavlova_lutheri.AAC.4